MTPPAPSSDAARIAPYLADIQKACAEQPDGFPTPEILAGVGLRETWLGWSPGYVPRGSHLGWGDNGHGWGLWQLDDRSHEDVILSEDLSTVVGQARRAAWKLAANLRVLRAALPGQPDDLLQRAAVAAYNARLGAVAAQLLSGRDIDSVTTAGPSGRGDYSADVFQRAQKLVDAGVFPRPG